MSAIAVRADWNDLSTPADALYCLLKWADTAQGKFYATGSSVLQELGRKWDGGSVTRAHRIRWMVSLTCMPSDLVVNVSLQAVGRTSWTVRVDFSSDGVSVASVLTTMVAVDEETLKVSVPVPRANQLRLLVSATEASEAAAWVEGFERCADTSGAFVWRSTVRLTDTDKLGHVNNAKYVFLAIEALYAASVTKREGPSQWIKAWGSGPSSLLDGSRNMAISYSGQLKAGDAIAATVWEEDKVVQVCFAMPDGSDACRFTIGEHQSTPSL